MATFELAPLMPAPVVELQCSGSIPIASFGMLSQAHLKYFIATKSVVSVLPVAFPHPPSTRGVGLGA